MWSLGILLALILLIGGVAFAVKQPWTGRARCEEAEVSAERLRAHVRTLVEDLSPRSHLDVENLDRIAAYVGRELEAAGARVSQQPFEVDGRTYRNVIGHLGPSQGPWLVVGAHYDTDGRLPGADDNASGVAGLLELARALSSVPVATPVALVAYPNEEAPHFGGPGMGSFQHAAALAREGAEVLAMISLEMLGTYSREPGSQAFPHPILKLLYSDRGDYIVIAARLKEARLTRRLKRGMRGVAGLWVESINGPASIPGISLSDHSSYWRHGFPAVMVTDTAFYRNPRYHTAQDTPETLDYERMALVVRGVACAVRDLAGKP
jgi:hypothetical protein